MIKKNIKIELSNGLEAQPVAVFVRVATQFDSKIDVEYKEKKVSAKSIMGMMSLGINQGEIVTVCASGSDEAQAIAEIEQYLSNKSGRSS